MNIWFLSAYDQPKGQSSRTYDYAIELTKLGHKVTFFTSSYNHFTHAELLKPGEKWREDWFGNVRTIWLKTIPYKDNGFWRGVNMLSNAWRAYWVGKSLKETPDVIFGPSVPLFTGLSAFLLSRQKKCYFCFEVRDIWPQALIDLNVLSKNNPITWLFGRIETFLYWHANRIIAVLPFAYRHICQYGIPRGQIFWVPNGIDFERFSRCKPYDGGEVNKLVVMYIGGFSSTHGIKVIIESAKYLQQEGIRGIRFVFIGEGREKEYYQQFVNDYQVRDVEFREPVKKTEISKVQEEADVLVASVKNTKVYQFGINSNKLFDYLASGRPIIFAVNSPNNSVVEANAGISIPPEDPYAMSEAIKTFFHMAPDKRVILGKNGREYAQKYYDIKILAKKLETILLELLEKGKYESRKA